MILDISIRVFCVLHRPIRMGARDFCHGGGMAQLYRPGSPNWYVSILRLVEAVDVS